LRATLATVSLAAILAACSSSAKGSITFDSTPSTSATALSAPRSATATTPTAKVAPTATSTHFGTLPPGATLPSDEECAARVRRGGKELRPSNNTFNMTKGHPAKNFPDPIFARVDGDFTGTTDEIIQWAACKWGIDEDIVRAQVAKESWWHQTNLGDFGTDPKACPPGHPIGADGQANQCPQSVGMLQVRYPYISWAFPDAETSSAFNLDVALAARRQCFEGLDTWVTTVEHGDQPYVKGDIWGCVGLWFAGRWYTQPAKEYTAAVQDLLARRIWTTSDFKHG
jgi:autotransporter family porin